MRNSQSDSFPRAFASGSDDNGHMVFRDWDSGMVIERYQGLYVHNGSQWLMRTWIDRSTGERAVSAVRRWDGVMENMKRREGERATGNL